MKHLFDTNIAKSCGIEEAIILENIYFWCIKNEANNKLVNGKPWTYNSVKAFNKLFNYITPSKISRALKNLESSGYIEIGEFNNNAYDHTKWYCITDKTRELYDESNENSICQNEKSNTENEKSKSPKSQINITDINTNGNTISNTDKFSEEDYKRCMNIYYENRSELSKSHEVINIKYSPKSYRGIIKPFFVEYGVETVLQAVRNSVNHYWAKTTDYGLGVIFNNKMFDEYVSGYTGMSSNNKSSNNPNFDKRKLAEKIDFDDITIYE